MKIIKILVILIFVFSVVYLPASYAEEDFVTSKNLSIEDVDAFVAALAREEAGIGRGSYVTINNIEQKDNHATVECEFCYVEATFTNVKHAPKKIVFERTESGKWLHVATGMYLTK
jgi:hypothetical protein